MDIFTLGLISLWWHGILNNYLQCLFFYHTANRSNCDSSTVTFPRLYSTFIIDHVRKTHRHCLKEHLKISARAKLGSRIFNITKLYIREIVQTYVGPLPAAYSTPLCWVLLCTQCHVKRSCDASLAHCTFGFHFTALTARFWIALGKTLQLLPESKYVFWDKQHFVLV